MIDYSCMQRARQRWKGCHKKSSSCIALILSKSFISWPAWTVYLSTSVLSTQIECGEWWPYWTVAQGPCTSWCNTTQPTQTHQGSPVWQVPSGDYNTTLMTTNRRRTVIWASAFRVLRWCLPSGWLFAIYIHESVMLQCRRCWGGRRDIIPVCSATRDPEIPHFTVGYVMYKLAVVVVAWWQYTDTCGRFGTGKSRFRANPCAKQFLLKWSNFGDKDNSMGSRRRLNNVTLLVCFLILHVLQVCGGLLP